MDAATLEHYRARCNWWHKFKLDETGDDDLLFRLVLHLGLTGQNDGGFNVAWVPLNSDDEIKGLIIYADSSYQLIGLPCKDVLVVS